MFTIHAHEAHVTVWVNVFDDVLLAEAQLEIDLKGLLVPHRHLTEDFLNPQLVEGVVEDDPQEVRGAPVHAVHGRRHVDADAAARAGVPLVEHAAHHLTVRVDPAYHHVRGRVVVRAAQTGDLLPVHWVVEPDVGELHLYLVG